MELHTEVAKEVETKLNLISQRASRETETRFNNLMHLVKVEYLEGCYWELGRNRASGIDGVRWQEYGEALRENLEELVGRMKRMGYRPQPARRVYIPKDKDGKRPLGIPALEDKVVQKAMSHIMEAIYEEDFLDFSYGFRPKRSPHAALKGVSDLLYRKPINYVVEADIKGFFDNVSHGKLMELIQRRITDKRFLRYIVRFLKSGYVEAGKYMETEKGTPQGGNLSPLLANIFLHYVLDEWFEKELKPTLRGQCYLIRYCDDFVVLVEREEEAKQITERINVRFKEYGLELHPEKSGVISFGRKEREEAKMQKRKAHTFEFLRFVHYCGVSRRGGFKVGRKTSKARLRKSLKAIGAWLRAIRNAVQVKEWWRTLRAKIQGHYNYYGVSENIRSLQRFYYRVVYMVHKWLNRRSQKKSFTWEGFLKYLEYYPLPKPRIVHRFY